MEAGRLHGTTSQHKVMPERVAVGRMRQRANQQPIVASSGKLGKVFADLRAGRLRGDRLELAAHGVRGVGLEVEAVLLRQSAGKKNIDQRLGGALLTANGFEGGEVVESQAICVANIFSLSSVPSNVSNVTR